MSNERIVEQHLPGYTRRVRRIVKVCPRCGKTFEAGPRAIYCSQNCTRAAWEERHPERAREQQRAAQARYDRKRRARAKEEGR